MNNALFTPNELEERESCLSNDIVRQYLKVFTEKFMKWSWKKESSGVIWTETV